MESVSGPYGDFRRVKSRERMETVVEVRMNNVLPGWINSLPATEERRESVPMGRYGKAEEIAATIAFLLSDGAGYITGQNIKVDGGLTRSV